MEDIIDIMAKIIVQEQEMKSKYVNDVKDVLVNVLKEVEKTN